MSRGAAKAPIIYEGEYDATRTYLPRQVVTVTAGAARTGYLSTATTTGAAPAANPDIWLPLGGGGGPIGSAIVEGAFPSSLSLGSNYATAVSIVDSTGDPGVSIISGDQLRFQPGTYVVTRNCRFAALSGGSSTLHLCYMFAPLIPLGSAMTFGTNPAVVANAHTQVLGFTTTDGMRVDFVASAGTPTYELEADVMQLFILRLSA